MEQQSERVSTGVRGLDEILDGGLIRRSGNLVRGGPGQGKTTLGFHFLSAAAAGEAALFIGFQEATDQLRDNAASMGIDISRIQFLSLAPDAQFFTEQQGYDIFPSADVEQEPLARAIVQAVEREVPGRVFIDSLTQLRFLSADLFQYRKQVLSLLRYLRERGATVMFSSESSAALADDDLQFIADGVINLESGAAGAAIRVTKLRGSDFRHGSHQMRVSAGGVRVFPRLLPPMPTGTEPEHRLWCSGAPKLDRMLHGGIESGTISLLTGPSGVGKSTLASLFVAQAARDGHRAAVYLFEEEMASFLRRADALQVGLAEPMTEGRVVIEPIPPLHYLADEFAARVCERVRTDGIRLVVMDSITGFELTLAGKDPKVRLHAFAKTLTRMGVTVLLVNEIEAMTTAEFRISERGISYLSDNVIFLHYMEVDGAMEKVIGVLKKRSSPFDGRLYTFGIGPGGLSIHRPVKGLQGVLTGTPMTQVET